MATVVLQTVGAAIGGAVGGPIGAMVGRTAGALAGAYVDQQIFGPGDRTVQGPRLDSTQALSSREGAPVAQVFGRARVAGEIIWATRFLEIQSSEEVGGKGGGGSTTTETYSYFANFAIGLCEGPVGGFGRIWADGKLLEQTDFTIRFYRGDAYQEPDSLIEARQGGGNTPAFRGLAYAVFENLPLADFGNRIPQIAVEVLRPVGRLEKLVSGVNMIPGATEFGYDPERVTEQISEAETRTLNVHQKTDWTDFRASLRELVSTCPNLKQVALVVAWFGDDLRASHCQLKPGVEVRDRVIVDGEPWHVAGFSRADAHLVSTKDGSPAYGGTPSDASVLRAIALIKSYGLKVCLNPFIMMDVPDGSPLPDPYGASQQAPYPWRGRITCHPAPLMPGSPDRSPQAGLQVQAFTGSTDLSQIKIGEGRVLHDGVSEYSYRRLILHYIRLAELAGGVDMFMVGSEMRCLTQVRNAPNRFPFVGALTRLAMEAKAVLGSSCFVTYGADWSEYFGYQPQDGSGDVFFHLDPLWANAAIDGVGIDNYMPLSDWRDFDDDDFEARTSQDPDYLASNMASGEGYDWYYESLADRYAKQRTPITDGLNKPWVFRYKDLKSWWSHYHVERRGGVELGAATAWQPASKPFVFTEYGCPAVHNGPAQPNVFYDPKSSESALPYLSLGNRDDQAQFAYIEAHQSHWDIRHPAFNPTNNPRSEIYGGRMVDMDRSQLWAWDARPYPYFPERSDLWTDAGNWHKGHWLNGRLGAVRLSDLIMELVGRAGINEVDASQVIGVFDGYLIGDITSPRSALEVLVNLYQLDIYEERGTLVFRSRGRDAVTTITHDQLVEEDEKPFLTVERQQESDIPASAQLNHMSPAGDFQSAITSVHRTNGNNLEVQSMNAPIIADEARMAPVLESWLTERWVNRETVQFGLDWSFAHLNVGDLVALDIGENANLYRITAIEEGAFLTINGVATHTATATPDFGDGPEQRQIPTVETGKVLVEFLDLPILPGTEASHGNRIAAARASGGGPFGVYASPIGSGFSYRQSLDLSATLGRLTNDFPPSDVSGRWSSSDDLYLELTNGALSSAAEELVLAGNNALAVEKPSGAFEVIQFRSAALVGPDTYRLSNLLRGQGGTEEEAALSALTGARVVLLNRACASLDIRDDELGSSLNWRITRSGGGLGDAATAADTFAPGLRGFQPYRPVHLSAHADADGNVRLTWVRRDRLNSDSWALAEIPQSEDAELYRVIVKDGSGQTLERETAAQAMLLDTTEIQTAFGTSLPPLEIAVAQISATVGAGPSATTFIA